MSNYPFGYPDNKLIVNGVDLTTNYQMILIDGYVLNPPEPKTYYVDIPGGNGVIDLSETVGGDIAYKNREQEFTFKLIYPDNFETTKTALSNFLHGKRYEYRLSMDPDYTYYGRFSVASYSHIGLAAGILGEIVISVSADPYKYKPDKVYSVNASGGKKFYFPSGRMPVRPVIQTNRATSIYWKGKSVRVGVGTFRLNDVLFQEGINELYINTYEIFDTTWNDIGPGGKKQLTWNEAKKYTYDELGRLTVEGLSPDEVGTLNPYSISTIAEDIEDSNVKVFNLYFMSAYSWNDIGYQYWGDVLEKKWTWQGLNYDPGSNTGSAGGSSSGVEDMGNAIAIITYEWGDL